MFEVCPVIDFGFIVDPALECIVFTWDYHSSISFWSGLRVQPILADEVQTFKALITVHKVLQEGHPVVSSDVLQDLFTFLTINLRPSRKHTAKRHGWKLVQERLEPTGSVVCIAISTINISQLNCV